MENWFDLQRKNLIYNVSFNEVLYEVQIVGDAIEGIYREDGYEMSQYEREGIRDYIYENIVK
jgi:hypothetical protein